MNVKKFLLSRPIDYKTYQEATFSIAYLVPWWVIIAISCVGVVACVKSY